MVSCGFLSGKQSNNIGLAVVRKNRIAGRYFQLSLGICEVDYCLLARATTPSPISLVDEASGSKYYSACSMPVLIYGLLSSYQTAPVHRIPSSTLQLLLFCRTHEVFLLPFFSLLQRGSSGVWQSAPLLSAPETLSWLFQNFPKASDYSLSYIYSKILPPTHASVGFVSFSVSSLRPPGLSTWCKRGHSKEMTEIATLWMARRFLL